MRSGLLALVIACAGSGCAPSGPVDDAHLYFPSSETTLDEEFRLVWVQDHSTEGQDVWLRGTQAYLMAKEGMEGEERRLLPDSANFVRPLLTPDGGEVIYSRLLTLGVDIQEEDVPLKFDARAIRWDGTGDRKIGEGYPLDILPLAGETWIYLAQDLTQQGAGVTNAGKVVRVRLDESAQTETVWEGAEITPDNIQFSEDGKLMVAGLPWPRAAVVELDSGKVRRLRKGCWPSLIPGTSGITWVFDGKHHGLQMDIPGSQPRRLSLVGAEETKVEFYHPRWSNHPALFAYTGPYTQGKGKVKIWFGGPQTEIFAGRFDSSLTGVESRRQLTRNDKPDFYPDLWIPGARRVAVTLKGDTEPGHPPASPAGPQSPGWVSASEKPVFAWADGKSENRVGEGKEAVFCAVERHDFATLDSSHSLSLAAGYARTKPETLPALAAEDGSGCAFELLITAPREASPGERPILTLFGDRDGEESASPGTMLLRLSQNGDALILTVRGHSRPLSAPVSPGKTTHLVISSSGAGSWKIHRDGALSETLEGFPALAPAPAPALLLGGATPGQRWDGTLAGIAAYRAPLSDAAAARHYRWWAGHAAPNDNKIERLLVKARLIEHPEIPRVEALAPYRNYLGNFTFEVEEVFAGDLDENIIDVQRWIYLDRTLLPDLPGRVGTSFLLSLERREAHPQLDSEYQDSPDDFTRPLFYDVTPIEEAAPKNQTASR